MTIDTSSTRMRIPTESDPQLFPQHGMNAFQGAIAAPFSQVIVDGLPGCPVRRQQTPSTARSTAHRARHSQRCVNCGVVGVPSELQETAVRAGPIRHRSGW